MVDTGHGRVKTFSWDGKLPTISIYADGADIESIRALANDDWISGFTTNPSLMRKAGVRDYRNFALAAAEAADDLPISFEVFADEERAIVKQAREIASWADNIYVKVPVINTQGKSMCGVIEELSKDGVKVNVTAVFTADQFKAVARALNRKTPAIISVFAGRIADAGQNPVEIVRACTEFGYRHDMTCVLWASPRQVFDVIVAERCGCDIITLDPTLISKLYLIGKDLTEFSRETVQMFFDDAKASGFTIGE